MERKTPSLPANFVDLLLDAVCVVDVEGRFVFVSAACERIFGYTAEEMIGTAMIDMVAPEDRARTLQAAGEIMSGNPNSHFENRYVRKDGLLVDIMWTARWSEADQLRIAVARDITARKRAESIQAAVYEISEAAHVAEDLLALFERIHHIIGGLLPVANLSVALREDAGGGLSFPYHAAEHAQWAESQKVANDALCAEVVRTGQPLLVKAETLPVLPQVLRALVDGTTECWAGVPLKSEKGTVGVLVLQSVAGGTCYGDKDMELLQFISTQVATAIERKQLQARLQYKSQYDELTDLPTRGLLRDRMETTLARARRTKGRMSVLFLDLDDFKHVNDTFGHDVGDLLLREVAARLKQCVRGSDTVARMGGDEFVVLLDSIDAPASASMVAEKIRRVLSQPLNVHAHNLCIATSIGIAVYPEHGDKVDQLLKYADDAMYRVKRHRADRRTRVETTPEPYDGEPDLTSSFR